MEDTETPREVIRETLEDRGYAMLLASNGEEALELARKREGPIHLLLTDVVMPKLGGGDLAKLLSALRPGIRVLYMSGYTDGAISQHGVLGEGVILLEPGIYSYGELGIRHEDTVVVTPHGCENLAPKCSGTPEEPAVG